MSWDILKHMSFETKESTSQDRFETDCFIVEVGEWMFHNGGEEWGEGEATDYISDQPAAD